MFDNSFPNNELKYLANNRSQTYWPIIARIRTLALLKYRNYDGFFQSSGNRPSSSDLLNNKEKRTHRCAAASFRTNGCRPLGPDDLVDFRCSIC